MPRSTMVTDQPCGKHCEILVRWQNHSDERQRTIGRYESVYDMKPLWIETNKKSRTQYGVDPKEERELLHCELTSIRRLSKPYLFTCANDFGAVPGCRNTLIRARSTEGDE